MKTTSTFGLLKISSALVVARGMWNFEAQWSTVWDSWLVPEASSQVEGGYQEPFERCHRLPSLHRDG